MKPYAPSQSEITEAIDTKNSELIAQFAIALDGNRRELREKLTGCIQAAADAKRDLDVLRAAIKNNDQTITLLQSVLKTLRPY